MTEELVALDEQWAWVLRARSLADRRPLLTDVAVAVGFGGIAAIQLIGKENRWWVWLLHVLLVAPLVVRRRRPFAVFLTIAAVAFAQWLTDVPLAADFGLLIALYTVALLESFRRTLLAGSVLEVGAVLASVRFQPDQHLAYSLVFLSGLTVAAIFVGVTIRTRRAYLDQRVQNARQHEIERANERQLAASHERTRIAREMHDIVAHSLSVMTALADGATLSLPGDPAQATTAISTVSTIGRQSMREMRRLLDVLRDDASPADRTPQPGLAHLDELAERLRLIGTTVAVTVRGTPQALSLTEDATAYRIVQESLTNVMRHATDVTTVTVALDWTPRELSLLVRDDGRSPAIELRTGHGLVGMSERVAMFGGELSAGPIPDGGWQVRAVLPVAAGEIEPSR